MFENKVMIIGLAALLALGLGACGDDDDGEKDIGQNPRRQQKGITVPPDSIPLPSSGDILRADDKNAPASQTTQEWEDWWPSSATIDMRDVKQMTVHQTYSMFYDATQGTTSGFVQFRLKSPTGVTLKLGDPSQLRFDGEGGRVLNGDSVNRIADALNTITWNPIFKLFKIGSAYYTEGTASGVGHTHQFTFTDDEGHTAVAEGTIPELQVTAPSSIDRRTLDAGFLVDFKTPGFHPDADDIDCSLRVEGESNIDFDDEMLPISPAGQGQCSFKLDSEDTGKLDLLTAPTLVLEIVRRQSRDSKDQWGRHQQIVVAHEFTQKVELDNY